jgi:hypothetical protein
MQKESAIFCWRWRYFYITVFLFFLEIFIASQVHDSFIRPYIGDMLVVVLLYTCCRTFLTFPKSIIAIAVFVFACSIECLQYFRIVEVLGLQHNQLATTVVGTTYSITDVAMYLIGTILAYTADKKWIFTNSNTAL